MTTASQSQRGAVALLTTVIVGILLTIITTSLVSLMVSELRQSNDAEQSVRAYYAAQSGVEDAVEKIIAAGGVHTDQDCGAAGSQNLNLEATKPGVIGWSCQRITYSGSPTGSLPLPDKAVQLDLGDAKFGSMIINWDTAPAPAGGYPAGYFDAPLGNFPASGVTWNHPAALEMAIITYPDTPFNAAAAGAIGLVNALISPRTSGGGPYAVSSIATRNPLAGQCTPSGAAYHCRVVIDNMNPGARNTVLRLRSRYGGTDYSLSFTSGNNGSGAVVNVPDGTATVDVTAKAGDAYRRVVYKVPLEHGAASGLDYVIYADTDVCKNFSTFAGAIESAGCPY